MTDSELIEHMHARGWRTEAIDVPMIREACKALQLSASAEPAGWKLVPIEPDGRMWSTGRAEFIRAAQQYEDARSAEKASIVGDVAGSDIYRAMLRAAPPPVTAAREQEASATGAEKVYLVCTGEVYEGRETYTRHDRAPQMCDFETLYATPTTYTTASEFPRRIVALLQEVAEGPFEDGNGECLMEDAKKALAWLANGEKNV